MLLERILLPLLFLAARNTDALPFLAGKTIDEKSYEGIEDGVEKDVDLLPGEKARFEFTLPDSSPAWVSGVLSICAPVSEPIEWRIYGVATRTPTFYHRNGLRSNRIPTASVNGDSTTVAVPIFDQQRPTLRLLATSMGHKTDADGRARFHVHATTDRLLVVLSTRWSSARARIFLSTSSEVARRRFPLLLGSGDELTESARSDGVRAELVKFGRRNSGPEPGVVRVTWPHEEWSALASDEWRVCAFAEPLEAESIDNNFKFAAQCDAPSSPLHCAHPHLDHINISSLSPGKSYRIRVLARDGYGTWLGGALNSAVVSIPRPSDSVSAVSRRRQRLTLDARNSVAGDWARAVVTEKQPQAVFKMATPRLDETHKRTLLVVWACGGGSSSDGAYELDERDEEDDDDEDESAHHFVRLRLSRASSGRRLLLRSTRLEKGGASGARRFLVANEETDAPLVARIHEDSKVRTNSPTTVAIWAGDPALDPFRHLPHDTSVREVRRACDAITLQWLRVSSDSAPRVQYCLYKRLEDERASLEEITRPEGSSCQAGGAPSGSELVGCYTHSVDEGRMEIEEPAVVETTVSSLSAGRLYRFDVTAMPLMASHPTGLALPYRTLWVRTMGWC